MVAQKKSPLPQKYEINIFAKRKKPLVVSVKVVVCPVFLFLQATSSEREIVPVRVVIMILRRLCEKKILVTETIDREILSPEIDP